MSPKRFHAHLQMLATMVPWTDGTWIDAFFFRAAAMVPPSHYLIMSAEQTLTHTASLYPKDGNAGIGKQSMLGDDVPRALCDMYAVAERTKQPILRGALTNGRDWIFLILSRNSDGRGATYKESAIISS
ncbi:hypothetical protein CPB85DRAFT_1438723 [Mucidula mucida]|nr:hypothetical protein CPB85DRAFT_1438723 [Mucidula mucida]